MAALGLRFTDGTTTVTVSNGTTGWLTDYRQGSVGEDEPESTDRARVILLSSLSTVQATISSLNKLYRQARNYARTGVGARVFVERDLGDATWWRSELLDALPLPVDTTLDLGIATGKVELDLVFTRRNYWEGAEAQIPLTNTNGTDDTSGLLVLAIDDTQATKDNFVDIDGVNDVTGDLPTPIKLEFKHTYNDAHSVDDIYLSLNINSKNAGGTWLQHILEGEDLASGGTAKPAVADYTLYSKGQYAEITVNTSDSAAAWTITDTFLRKAVGGQYRVMARCRTTPTAGTWVYLDVYTADTLVVAKTEWHLLDATGENFQDIGIIEFPTTWLDPALTFETVSLRFHTKCPAGATTLDLDYIQLCPLDGWRHLAEGVLLYNCTVIDAPYDKRLYNKNTSAQALPAYVAYGSEIRLEPGVLQRLYIFWDSEHYAYRTATVKAWYRPRRLVI